MKITSAVVFAGLASASNIANPHIQPTKPCASLTAPRVDGASITSVNATQKAGICSVRVYLTHDNSTDNVLIITWLPVDWNGRYQGTGGSLVFAGGSVSALQAPVAAGYVASTTDGGLPSTGNGSEWADNPQLVNNFAYQSIHDMTVVGKALAEDFYGTPVNYSYFNGCSTGGRQGYMEAQKYPQDYQGIYAASPAINYDRFQVAELWPYVVQNVEGEFVPQCILTALKNAAITFCDGDDGGYDNLISNPNACQFDATTWIGKSVNCAGNSTITARQAKIFNSIAHGPVDTDGNKLFSGMTLGTSYSVVAGRTPFPLMAAWVQAFVLKQPDFDLASMTYETFPVIFNLSHAEWDERIGTDNPDMSSFQEAGGKLLSWHGWADSLIGGNGTVDYRTRVQAAMGGPEKVDDFYRLFMAPGVDHCGGGTGAAPTDPFDALVAWVENGTAPDTLPAQGTGENAITRNLCRFPLELQYSGSGDINLAESWTCA